MQLTFEDLATLLPPGSIEFIGNNQLKLNLTQLTGEDLRLESSLLETVAKLLDALAQLTSQINEPRIQAVPPKPRIRFVDKDFDGTPSNPEIVFDCRFGINPASFSNNLFDPTAE